MMWKQVRKIFDLTEDSNNVKNYLDMNIAEVQELLMEYAKNSNKDVRKYAKNSLAVINEEEFDINSTLTSTTSKSIRSRVKKPKK